MIPIYLCEDDIRQLEYWKKIISNAIIISEWDMHIKAACISPYELMMRVDKRKPENAIYFLDIDLKSTINGIELATQIRKYDPRAFIIFVTTHDEMAIHAIKYKVEPLDFIVKESNDFRDQMVECLQNAYHKYQVPNNPVTDVLSISMGSKVIIIPLDDIYYIEPSTHSHKIRIHKRNEILEFSSSLAELKTKLDDRFMMCHKAYIVNCKHIRRVDKKNYTVYMDDNKTCPCSVRLCNPLCRKLIDYPNPNM